MVSTEEQAKLQRLREENKQLKALLTRHGIAWQDSAIAKSTQQAVPKPATDPEPKRFSTAEKIVLFRRLFRGRTDVYPQRWESTKGDCGYSPVCANKWRQGICCKPKIKCGDCSQRIFSYSRLTGSNR